MRILRNLPLLLLLGITAVAVAQTGQNTFQTLQPGPGNYMARTGGEIPAPPSAPFGLEATSTVSGIAELTWQNAGGPVEGQIIQRCDGDVCIDFETILDLSPATDHATDNNAVPGSSN